MLERLTVTDLALVERAEITLGAGLNVVTGETGAGKTLLVDALSLLLGGKPEPDAVREGARAAVVEGEFRIGADRAAEIGALAAEWGIDFDGETLIVRREVQPNGRSRVVVNQAAVTVGALQRLGERLADFHGQHEHQSLLRPEGGLEALDRLAGLESERDGYRESLAAWREASGELERLEQQLRTYSERRDYLMEAARELDDARLEDGEEESLAREAARLAHADRLRELVAGALSELVDDENAAADRLGRALHAVEQASSFDPSLEERLTALREATISANEAARALADYAGHLQADPGALEQVEERRDLIARLTRKYRRSVPELLDWRDELSAELETGEDAEGTLQRAQLRESSARVATQRAADQLSARRRSAADEWSRLITRELRPLGFASARLEFVTTARDPENAAFHSNGPDRVEMSFTPNPGESARPLPRIASGGELSRVMLALKCALQARDRVDLLVFDEVDSGIGGAVAQAVGERLRQLAEHRQILCVTHLALIAALGNQHVRVFKRAEKGRTVTRVDRLEGAERVEELARMLAGDRVTETTRRQARELLSPARAAAR